MKPRSLATRLGSTALLAAAGMAIVAIAAFATPAHAAEGDQRTTIFVGSTTYSDGDATSQGTTFGVKWALEFQKDLEWSISGAYTATDGKHETGGQEYDVSATSTTLQSGLTVLFNNEPTSAVVPFIGAGLSLLFYELDFDYPDSNVGKTSGFGPGVFGLGGVEIRFTRTIHFIPEYVLTAHSIETEDGDRYTLISGGLLIALRISF